MNKETVSSFLEEKVIQYQQPQFIETDPIQIPYLFPQDKVAAIKPLISMSSFLLNR